MDNWNIAYFLYVYSEFHSTLQTIKQCDTYEWKITYFDPWRRRLLE